MANNRLYIGCRECAEWLYLDKHFGGPFSITEEKLGELNDFLERHAYCGFRDWAIDFELFDECTDDKKTWTYYMRYGTAFKKDEEI